MTTSSRFSVSALVVCVLVPNVVGVVSGLASVAGVSGWYQTLARPFFTPPSWVFGPVWTALYTTMGVASYLVWRRRGESDVASTALVVYGAHLVVNGLWSVLFFGMQSPALALVDIVVLLALVVWTMRLFGRVRPVAAWLLAPYLAWAGFATALNFEFWRLNPG